MNESNNRWKSPVLWGSFLMLIFLICKHWFGFEIPGWADISTEIIAFLSLVFGVANNPTDRSHF